MSPTEYNLLDEHWIRVLKDDCSTEEVSLTDALIKAHHYVSLSGEMTQQDVAVMRVLIAVLHKVFCDTDENGDDAPLETAKDALDRWKTIWEMGRFPEKPILDYLGKWRDRFWLFDPVHPFYQANVPKGKTDYTVAKLDGEIASSNSKKRLFSYFAGENKTHMSYGDAARWLIYQNGFDDSAIKPPRNSGLPSTGYGWLGKLGLICAVGSNLFETLMLNLCLLDGRTLWEESNRPTWELDEPRTGERVEIPMPLNQSELLTLQSRRLLLIRDEEGVVSYYDMGGDFFDAKNSFSETMTVWEQRSDAKGKVWFSPRPHDSDTFVWQEFDSFISDKVSGSGQKSRRPGVVTWLETLQTANILPRDYMVRLLVSSVKYDSKGCSMTDSYSDEISLHAGLLSDLGGTWRSVIEKEVASCKKCGSIIGYFAYDLARASGDYDRDKNSVRKKNLYTSRARTEFFSEVDMPFRMWLAERDINETPEMMEAAVQAWHKQVRGIAFRLCDGMLSNTGDSAFIGRMVPIEPGSKVFEHMSVPEAFSKFKRNLHRCCPLDIK